jgi:hypothetical protein
MLKKSQITIFIVLGIVVFVIFGLLFYMVSSVKTKQFTEEKQEITTLFTTEGKYYGYMQACLDQAAKQGIILAAMQGGVIYQYQANNTKPYLGPRKYEYGQYVLPFNYEDVIYNVSYGIYAPDFSLNIENHPAPPEYPYGLTRLIEDPTVISPEYTNVFGNILLSPLPPLCDYYGSNSPTQQGAIFSCETYDSKRQSDNDNVQEYLQTYIAQTFKDCVSLESLPEFANTTMNVGNVTAIVTFAPTSISIVADFPVIAEITGATLSLQTFHAQLNIRFQQIHELAERLIKEDINNIFFNIVRDANELVDCKELGKEEEVVRCLKDGMTVAKYRDVCTQCKNYGKYDDIVIIKDEKSMINGKPFVFAFAVQNRYPALEYIDESSSILTADVGGTIHIEPIAYDPDEDDHGSHDYMEHRYVYGGWKEDYDEIAGVKSPGDVIGFTDSSLYQSTQRIGEYTAQLGDVGEHIVQIMACDNEGLCDYQYVTVTVNPLSIPIN